MFIQCHICFVVFFFKNICFFNLKDANDVDQAVEVQPNEADPAPGQNNGQVDGLDRANPPVAAAGANNNGGQPAQPAGQVQAPAQAQDDVNWNLMEWDRGEELTWERLLGLDGSLVFLEHVFWVASLNALFILVFGTTIHVCGHLNLFLNNHTCINSSF